MYGKVIFREGGEKGARLQRILTERLNAQGVITVPKEKIEKWYDMDRAYPFGCACHYVLHDKNEVDIFKTIMQSEEMQDESVRWKVTRFSHDRKFMEWVREAELENCKEADDNGKRKKV